MKKNQFRPILVLTFFLACLAVSSVCVKAAVDQNDNTKINGTDFHAKAQGTANAKLGATYLTKVANISGGIKLYWNRALGASGYVIYRAYREDTSFDTLKTITKGSTTSFTDTTAISGVEYCYSIYAYTYVDGQFVRTQHDRTGTYITYLNRPSIKKLSNVSNGIKVQWNKTSIDSTRSQKNYIKAGYYIYRKAYGAETYTRIKKITKITTSSYTDQTAVKGKKYTYAIRAYATLLKPYDNLKNYTSVSGINSAGKTITRSGSSSQPTASVEQGATYRALLIGNSAYVPTTFNPSNPANDPYAGTNLYGPYNDVRVMRYMLNGMNYSSVVVKENARKSTILSAIKTTFAGADSNDVSLFYYTGHGVTDEDSLYSGTLYLPQTTGGYSNHLNMTELAKALKAVPGKVIVMLDACGSGAAITAAVGASQGLTDNTGFDPEAFNDSVIGAFSETGSAVPKYGELIQSNKFYVLTAAKAFEDSWDLTVNDIWGSVFTRGIVNGAGYRHGSSSYSGSMPADVNKDKLITMEEAYSYAVMVTRNLGKAYDLSQTIKRYPTNSSFVLYRKK